MSSGRRLAAIVFTDLEGFTSLTQRDERGALALLEEQRGLVDAVLATRGGRLIKSMGDGLLLEFPNARDAVEGAVELQRSVRARNLREADRPLRLRIGIHLGDVEERGSDILGDAVNIASRIEPLADAGGICCSAQVHEQVRNKVPVTWQRLGPRALKGVDTPVEIYRVGWGEPAETAAPRSAPARAGPPRIAVLPLANISPDPRDEYFADGLTEELISTLSQLRGLRVLARTSVNQYKGTVKPVSQIGAELGATSLLEGSVRKSGSRIRITLQLIDVASQEHTWSESYNRNLEDVFAIQAEVAERTAAALQLQLGEAERVALLERPTESVPAYDAYLHGIREFGAWIDGLDPARAREAIRWFEEAIRADPDFALARAYLANVLMALAGEALPSAEVFPRARALLDRALELDPDSSEAHVARGNLAMQADLDWARAEEEFQRALALNPSSWTAHFWYGSLLEITQRFPESEVQMRLGLEQNPLLLALELAVVSAPIHRGDLDGAIRAWTAMGERLGWPLVARWNLAWLHVLRGERPKALELVSAMKDSTSLLDRFSWALLEAFDGRPAPARDLAEELSERSRTEYVPARFLVALLALVGEKDRALARIEKDFDSGDYSLVGYYAQVALNPLRDDPRFVALLRRAHLPTEANWPWSRMLPPAPRPEGPGASDAPRGE